MSKPLNPYDPTNYVETGLIRSKSLSPQGKENWDVIFGKKPTKHEAFCAWVGENYQGHEHTEVMDHYVQSGDYPEDFLEEYLK